MDSHGAPDLELTAPCLRWGCVRCGKQDGWARCEVPVLADLQEPLMRELRRKVLRYHWRADRCPATQDDLRFAIDDRQRDVTAVGVLGRAPRVVVH